MSKSKNHKLHSDVFEDNLGAFHLKKDFAKRRLWRKFNSHTETIPEVYYVKDLPKISDQGNMCIVFETKALYAYYNERWIVV